MLNQARKRRISLVLIFSLLLSTLILPVIAFGAASVQFKDVADSYAQQEIQALAEAGIISGYDDNTFQPRQAMTRAELAKIIVLSLGLKENPDKAASFQDVDSKSWYRGYVGALVESGITAGTSATTFSPENKVTREELVVFFIRALGLEESAKKVAPDGKLTDLNEVSDWAKAHVLLSFKVGFVNGIEVNGVLKFNPKDNAERQALARLAYEFKTNRAKYVEKAKEISGETKDTPAGTNTGTTQGPAYGSGSGSSGTGTASFTVDTVQAADNRTVEVTFTSTISSSDDVKPFTIDGGLTVVNQEPKYGTKTIVLTTSAQTVGQTYTVAYNGVDTGKTFAGKATTLSALDASTYTGSYRVAEAGTFGPASGSSTINGNFYVESGGVTLQNATINGDLVLGEQIGEGDVTLNNVTVTGQTFVNGGGANSIHLQNTVLVSIIVDKRSGEVRVVAEGTTSVQQVTVQSSATLEESNASGNGFQNLSIPSNTQANSFVTLRGTFETVDVVATNIAVSVPSGFIHAVNVRAEAANAAIHLVNTIVASMRLDAVAAITGPGVVQEADIYVSDTTFDRLPNHTRLGNGARPPQQSEPSSDTNTLQTITVSNGGIGLSFNRPVTDAVNDDFNVTATLNGQDYQLQDLLYNSAEQRFTFRALPADQYQLQELSISVSPAPTSTKFIRTASGSVKVTGFEGTIYDVSYRPVSGLTIKFRAGIGSIVGPVAATVVTDANGHYKITLPPGSYTGELSKEGYITTYVVGVAATNVYNRSEDATAIRIAAAEETRIVLVWGENPRDLDSHLVGPQPNAVSQFHTWYANKTYSVNSAVYDDLDHDDVTSYGPETTTIRQDVYGTYRFYVHHFSGTNTLRTSGAVVKVYRGNSADPVRTYSVPTGAGSERYWAVFDMTLTESGVSFTEINQLVNIETEAQGVVQGISVNVATVTSSVYSVNQTAGTITYGPPEPSVTNFKSGLTPAAGATFEVYESDGTTVKTGTIASGDKVIVTAANGITKKIYTVGLDTAAPATVTGITYTATSNSIHLSWQPSSDNSGTVTYAVYNGTTQLATTTGTTYNVTSLQPATSYTFDIRAFDPSGNYSGHSYQTAKTNVTLSVYNVYTASNNTVTSDVYGPLTKNSAVYTIPNSVNANDYFVVQFSDSLASDYLTGVLANNSTISLGGLAGTVEASVYQNAYLVFKTTNGIPAGSFNVTIRGLKNTVSSVVYDVDPITLNFNRLP